MADMKVTNPLILLAEDDEDDQEFITLALKKLEPRPDFHITGNGLELLRHLARLPANELPCLIVLDLNMPGLNGLQTLEALTNDPKYSSIPKVIFTTSDSETDKKNCLRKGATDYIVKPNSLDDVAQAIGNMLKYCSPGAA